MIEFMHRRKEAAREREEAEAGLAQTRAEAPVARGLAAALHAMREENHLAETFQSALGRGRP